jgi:hypothetical protein
VSALLEDRAVQARIAESAELRNLAADSAVVQGVGHAAEMMDGMAALLSLVALLLEDPQVTARIEAQEPLRVLWADDAVRAILRSPRR